MDKIICSWATATEHERDYHDNQWGNPTYDDSILFEFLVLESMQAGLSWSTILTKRQGFKDAFDNFNIEKVAIYDNEKIDLLLNDKKIIRNKLKINAAVNNANRFLEIQKKYNSFSDYIWQFVNHKPIINSWKSMGEVPSNTELSDKITKELKTKGFKFIGTTIIYSYMQAIGMVNDHTKECFLYKGKI